MAKLLRFWDRSFSLALSRRDAFTSCNGRMNSGKRFGDGRCPGWGKAARVSGCAKCRKATCREQ